MRAKVRASSSLASICSRLISWPGLMSQVCLVSHHGQPTPHPCRRTNTDGVPAWRASPWMDWNTSLTAKVSDMVSRAALARLVHLHAHETNQRARQQVQPNLRYEMGRDVLGGGVERDSDDAGVDAPECVEHGVLFPDQHAVIPRVL